MFLDPLNHLGNIEIVRKGVSDKNETATLYFPSLTTASINKHIESDIKVDIELVTLDSFAESKKLSTIDIIKLDVEGHELQALEGALNTIEKYKPIIIIELSTYIFNKNESIILITDIFCGCSSETLRRRFNRNEL